MIFLKSRRKQILYYKFWHCMYDLKMHRLHRERPRQDIEAVFAHLQ